MCCVMVCVGLFVVTEAVVAQFGRDSLRRARERAEEKRTKLLEEHASYLERARENQILEGYLQEGEGVGRRRAEALPSAVLGRDAGVTIEQLAREKRGSAFIEAASENLSPEARAIVEKRSILVAQAEPISPDEAPPVPSLGVNPGKVPVPEEIKPKSLTRDRGLLAEINAQGAVHFDAATNMMVFTDEVVVDHTGFHLECDRLEIILKANAALGAGVTGGEEVSKEEPTTDPEPGSEGGEGGVVSVDGDDPIEQAIASGGMVTITKKDAEGKLKTGRARKVVYEAATGDITMREYPQVQSGQSLMIATDESTIIVMKADGNHYAVGPHRMEIVADDDEEGEGREADAAVATPGNS